MKVSPTDDEWATAHTYRRVQMTYAWKRGRKKGDEHFRPLSGVRIVVFIRVVNPGGVDSREKNGPGFNPRIRHDIFHPQLVSNKDPEPQPAEC